MSTPTSPHRSGQFDAAAHPRSGDGKFAVKPHAEADLDAIALTSADASRPSDAFALTEQRRAADLRVGDIIAYQSTDPDGPPCDEYRITAVEPVAAHAQKTAIAITSTDLRGIARINQVDPNTTLPVARTCPRHGGAWGNDGTCEDCADDNGYPRSFPQASDPEYQGEDALDCTACGRADHDGFVGREPRCHRCMDKPLQNA